jgi:hypothetical protein
MGVDSTPRFRIPTVCGTLRLVASLLIMATLLSFLAPLAFSSYEAEEMVDNSEARYVRPVLKFDIGGFKSGDTVPSASLVFETPGKMDIHIHDEEGSSDTLESYKFEWGPVAQYRFVMCTFVPVPGTLSVCPPSS